MKKTLFALAALAVGGSACAQSSVTLFGVVDATAMRGSGSTSSRTQLGNSGYTSSRVGFRGVEDLGGGLKAGFHLEAGINNDDGRGAGTSTNNQASGGNPSCTVATTTTTTTTATPAVAGTTLASASTSTSSCAAAINGGQGLTFNRRSTVSMGGSWGEVRFGRDYTPQFWNQSVYDPFNTNGVGTNQVATSNIGGTTNTRASNSFTYLWGHGFNASTSNGGNGFHALVQYYLGENSSGAATSSDASGWGVRAGYNGGPISVAGTYSHTNFASGDITSTSIGGAYDFGIVRPMFMWERDRVASRVRVTGTGWLVGAHVPVGAGVFRVAHSRYRTDAGAHPGTRKTSIGYLHNLSKRTTLYATYARVGNSGGATQALNGSATGANRSSSGLDIGVRHVF
jgi:predicted porin